MPYKINTQGFILASPTTRDRSLERRRAWADLTPMQREALLFFVKPENEEDYHDVAEVAKYCGYPNGQWFRGVLSSLHRKGLLDKGEE